MPAAEGIRVPYDELPATIREWIDETLASRVVEAVTQPGGFSPGVAARLEAADGSRAFVKAVSVEANPRSPEMHRREAAITAALPAAAPTPRLLASYDADGWVALLLEDIDGRHPRLPWEEDELRRVVATIDELFDDLTPCPLLDAPRVDETWRDEFTGWRDAVGAGVPAGLDEWCVRHIDPLAQLESRWVEAASGDTLLHLDLRADNMLVSADGVWLVDWPWAARGAPVFDLAAFAPSVAMQGGPEPADLLALSRYGRKADRQALVVLVATITGYFLTHGLRPPDPGLPTVRAFQAAQGAVALRWLQTLTGWT